MFDPRRLTNISRPLIWFITHPLRMGYPLFDSVLIPADENPNKGVDPTASLDLLDLLIANKNEFL